MEQRDQALQAVKAEKRATFAAACIRSFISSRHRVDTEFQAAGHAAKTAVEAKVQAALKKKARKAPDAKQLLRKQMEKVNKSKAKEVVCTA